MDMDYAIAKMSTKGQIVIPKELRAELEAGDEFLIVRDEDRFVLTRMEHVSDQLRDDLEFARRVEAAYARREGFTKQDSADFLEDLDTG